MIISLIGMPGVGKSTVGKTLSKKLQYAFVDTDTLIEARYEGRPLYLLLEKMGEKTFLQLEEETLLALKLNDNTVLSPGGSIVYSLKAMTWLKTHSLVVFLRDTVERIQKRLVNLETRGIIGLEAKGLITLYNERLPLYEHYADITVTLPYPFNKHKIVSLICQKLGLLS